MGLIVLLYVTTFLLERDGEGREEHTDQHSFLVAKERVQKRFVHFPQFSFDPAVNLQTLPGLLVA